MVNPSLRNVGALTDHGYLHLGPALGATECLDLAVVLRASAGSIAWRFTSRAKTRCSQAVRNLRASASPDGAPRGPGLTSNGARLTPARTGCRRPDWAGS